MPNEWYKALWLVLATVWLAAAVTSKRTVQREAIADRILHGSLLAVAFVLLFQPRRLGLLDVRFIPDTPAATLCGLAITAVGIAFAIWARLTIGRNWSGFVTIKEDHQLVRRGPYRIVRHPIYSGILLAMAGTAIGYGRVPCLIGLPIAVVAFWTKWRTEERFMLAQFGAEYTQYQQEVKAIVPGLL